MGAERTLVGGGGGGGARLVGLVPFGGGGGGNLGAMAVMIQYGIWFRWHRVQLV